MSEDPELAAIRSRRMAEMQGGGGGMNQEQMQKQQEAMKRDADMKNTMLSQILDQGARARLNSIALVKPEKAKMVEQMLIQMEKTGQIGGRLNEDSLVGVLERVNQQMERTNKVTINHRRYAMGYATHSDDDDY